MNQPHSILPHHTSENDEEDEENENWEDTNEEETFEKIEIDMNDPDVWDDTALIDAYETSIREYCKSKVTEDKQLPKGSKEKV
jgi:hypothetical protein